MHDGEAHILACVTCGLLIRDEGLTKATSSYEEDPNDPGVMQHVYGRYVDSFRKKSAAYRDRLPPHASVIELGPHLGAFLQTAEEWDWRPVGLDIGKDTSEFARKHGLTVRRETIDDTKLKAASADAVFIWNCFEQLAEPEQTLIAARQLLQKHGVLVLRVPNAASWLQMRKRNDEFARGVLAWNNLLGFPYLFGYNETNLTRLTRQFGFEPVTAFASELITMPFPDPAADVIAEQASVSNQTRLQHQREANEAPWIEAPRIEAPWIEILFRREEEIRRCWPRPSSRFLPRAVA